MGVSYNRLWKMLIDKNMKRQRCSTSLGSVETFLPGWENQYVSMETIEKICKNRPHRG